MEDTSDSSKITEFKLGKKKEMTLLAHLMDRGTRIDKGGGVGMGREAAAGGGGIRERVNACNCRCHAHVFQKRKRRKKGLRNSSMYVGRRRGSPENKKMNKKVKKKENIQQTISDLLQNKTSNM